MSLSHHEEAADRNILSECRTRQRLSYALEGCHIVRYRSGLHCAVVCFRHILLAGYRKDILAGRAMATGLIFRAAFHDMACPALQVHIVCHSASLWMHIMHYCQLILTYSAFDIRVLIGLEKDTSWLSG